MRALVQNLANPVCAGSPLPQSVIFFLTRTESVEKIAPYNRHKPEQDAPQEKLWDGEPVNVCQHPKHGEADKPGDQLQIALLAFSP